MNIKSFNPYLNHNTYHIFFINLANPLKIGIIISLRGKSKNVTQISNELHVEQSKISHALQNLKKCNIVNADVKGKERVYSLNKKTILPMLRLIDRHSKIHCKNECSFNKSCGGKCK